MPVSARLKRKGGSPKKIFADIFITFYSVNYKKYKAFYRVRGDCLEVVRIIMAKRDYMKILFGEHEEMLDDL